MFKEKLEPYIDVSKLTEEEYALVRKDTLGASDSSILCGVNLYKKKDQLIAEKNAKYITDAEKQINKKPAVCMGRDLEPFVLAKFAERHKVELIKPTIMYRAKEFPYLTINFDGVIPDTEVSVEAKCVTRFGEKYYNKLVAPENIKALGVITTRHGDIVDHIKYYANKCGIPAYYYTQCQQQIYGTNKDHGWLTALFVDTWTMVDFYIPRDEITINHIIVEGAKLSEKIIKQKED